MLFPLRRHSALLTVVPTLNVEEALFHKVILPVFIFFDGDKEIDRVIGEVSEKEMLNKLREVGLINEESN